MTVPFLMISSIGNEIINIQIEWSENMSICKLLEGEEEKKVWKEMGGKPIFITLKFQKYFECSSRSMNELQCRTNVNQGI